MNNKRTTFGIGMMLVVLALAMPVSALSPVYFEPDPSSATTDNSTWVIIYCDMEPGETLKSGQLHIITDVDDGSGGEGVDHSRFTHISAAKSTEEGFGWESVGGNTSYVDNGHLWVTFCFPIEYDEEIEEWHTPKSGQSGVFGPYTETKKIRLARIRIVTDSTLTTPGITPLNFSAEHKPADCPICQDSDLYMYTGTLPTELQNGTFTHIGESEPFEKELVPGWNLISLPLKPDNNSTSAVLSSISGKYDAVFRYDATAKEFEVVTDGTMDPGIGYFVDVTTAGTWSYMGSYTSTSVDLKPGLNCIGWGDTSANLPDALSPITGNYNYTTRWDADNSTYEVYDANAPEGVSEFIDFTTMERGNGYWIAAKEDCTLNV